MQDGKLVETNMLEVHMRTAHQSSSSHRNTDINIIHTVLAVSKCSLLKRVRHLGCIDFEVCHYQAGRTTNHTFCTLAADIDANRQCTLQRVKHIIYVHCDAYTHCRRFSYLHTMTTVYIYDIHTHVHILTLHETINSPQQLPQIGNR